MKKKLLLLTLLTLTFACARGADKIQQSQGLDNGGGTQPLTSSILWSSIGGNAQSNNVVSGQLPQSIDPTFSAIDAPEADLNVYSSPVIYKDVDDTPYVFALWAKAGVLRLVKYSQSGGALTPDNSFNVTLTSSLASDAFKAHQVVLSKEGSEIYVYVSHKDGVTKYTTSGEEVLKFGTSNVPAYGILTANDRLYVQTETNFNIYNLTNISNIKSFNYSGDSEHPTMAIPLVVSGDHVYVAHSTKVFKVGAQDLELADTFTTTNKIKNIVAYNAGVIIASRKIDEISLTGADTDELYYTFTTLHYTQFGGAGSGDYPQDFPDRFHKGVTKAETSSSFKRSAIGDASYAAIIVNGSDYYVHWFLQLCKYNRAIYF